jgi:hypothetical protein
VVKNSSEAPLRWSHGLIFERGQYLYVTSGIGTSIVPWRWRVPPEIVALEVTGTSTESFGMDRFKRAVLDPARVAGGASPQR